MKYTTLALVLGLGAFSPAFSADWTGLLQGMQNDCETQTIVQKLHKKTSIPKALRGDIVKYTAKEGNYSLTSHVDIRLKNATAFGKSITRIYNDESQWGSHSLNVYFTDGNFANIKSKFTVTVNGQKHAVGKNKSWLIPYDENEEPQKAVSIPYKGVDYKKYQHLDDYNSPHIINTHGNGWWDDNMSGESMGRYIRLDFDSKKKMVSCSSAFG
ncbi:hypothetical protein [Moraxella sp. VT-16-12]|uniref:hypothetical protein n=1 Tax=Moraxella sp. VT-16-12 TaxID=2014877 RepID=UPI000B7DCB2D|nr:hypothetical protein [Moraxella sp. VT-16-12]TWV84743.1 hypothetical protein CEW93_000770 [Moraxella sp. VT-16-12]